jgi:hypothetical protein
MELLDPPHLYVLLALSAMLLGALLVRRRVPTAPSARDDSLDTVQAWPPQAVRVMTLGERQAFEVLRRALPAHVVLSQVPLSRFISVPTRNPYQQWLQRAGRLAVDILVCDYSSRALAAIEVRTAEESERSAKRHERLMQVLRAAGVVVYEWNEDALPSVAEVRELFTTNPASPAKDPQAKIDAGGRRLIPVAEISEVLADGDATDYGQLEPVPSAFYDDQDDARAVRRAA